MRNALAGPPFARRQQGQRTLDPAHLPHGAVAVPGEVARAHRGRQRLEIAAVERRPLGKIRKMRESARRARAASRRLRAFARQMSHQPQPQAQRRRAVLAPLERAVPVARSHLDRAHLDAVRARIAHQLRRRVEPHRLAVDQRGAECRRLVALEPGGDVDQQREARGVGLGKAVFAEALDLLEDLPANSPRSRARACRRSDPRSKGSMPPLRFHAAMARRSRSASPGREAGRDDRELHHLFLEDRHAQRALEYRLHGLGSDR